MSFLLWRWGGSQKHSTEKHKVLLSSSTDVGLGQNPEPMQYMLRCCLQNVEYNPTIKATNKSSDIVKW